MATKDTKTLIETSIARLVDEVPALRKLAMVLTLELRERGGPALWRIETPGPKVTRDPTADGKITVAIDRPAFNLLAEKGHLTDWVTAFDKGVVRVTGDQNVIKLIGKVIELQRSRAK
jgi:hypothetical protein